MTINLSEEQITFSHDQGYLAIPHLTTELDVAFLRQAYDRIFAERAGRELGDQFDPAGTDEDEANAALPQILNPAKYAAVSIWVPLQEATELNGCMEFVPGSHRADVIRHRSINNVPRIHSLELHPAETKRTGHSVRCPLPAGGATFHGPYMLHHTGPNRSQIPSRALIFNAALPTTMRETLLRFPWMDEKMTARDARAKEAMQKGLDPGVLPTGAISRT